MSSETAVDHSRRALRIGVTISTLLFSGAIATPSFANYFHNPYLNVNRNIGSAPSPTPQDIRENRLPTLVHPAPRYADVAAENADKPAISNESRRYDVRGRNLSVGQLSRQLFASIVQTLQGVVN
jgi:hypothetical protein